MSKNISPKVRFKGCTDAWEQRKFGDVGSVSMCKRIFKDETLAEGEIPFYKIGTFGGKPDAFISRELFEEYKSKFSYPKKGDILLSASGTIGRIVEYNGEEAYFQDSNIVWLSHEETVDNKFLKALYPIVEWAGIEGSTIKRLYNDNFLKTEFMMPSVGEQEKIGAFFEYFDNTITLHQRKLKKMKTLKESMLQKMFPRDDSNIPEVRLKGFVGTWELRRLNTFVHYSSSNLTVKDSMKKGYYDLYDANSIIGKTNHTPMIENYITIIKDGAGVGRIRMLPKNTMFIGTMGALTAWDSDLNFVFTLLTANNLGNMFSGSTIPHIYFKDYGENIYFIPHYDEQRAIGNYFKKLNSLIELENSYINKLLLIKQAFLDKMFVRVEV